MRQFSPVLRDSLTRNNPMRALPGSVIITLDSDWSQTQALDWFERNDLIVIRALEFQLNTYLINSVPGLHSLKLANQLSANSEVISAIPDWWIVVRAR